MVCCDVYNLSRLVSITLKFRHFYFFFFCFCLLTCLLVCLFICSFIRSFAFELSTTWNSINDSRISGIMRLSVLLSYVLCICESDSKWCWRWWVTFRFVFKSTKLSWEGHVMGMAQLLCIPIIYIRISTICM